jgi:predicted Zn-dependent protease
MPLDPARARKILSDAISAARKAAGGAKIEVFATLVSGREANTRFAKNEITSSGDVDETTVSLEVAIGKRHAGASTNQTDPASLRGVAENAARLAAIAPEDPEYVPVLGPQKYAAAPSAFDPATDKLSAATRVEAARVAIAAAKTAGVTAAGFYEHAGQFHAMLTSAGLFAHHAETSVDYSLTARSQDGSGSGWAARYTRKAQALDAAAVSKIAVDKAVRSKKPQKLDPGRYTVVLEPDAVGTLLGFLVGAMDARPADEGRSFFSKPGGGTRLGEKLFPDGITVRSDPSDREIPSAPFDGEGFPLAPMTWIDKGRIAGLFLSRYWAQKTGKKPTGDPASYHMHGGSETLESLIAGVKRGVLITRFWYANLLEPQALLATGLTRDGTFLIENGKVVAPVNNFRWNESPMTMLKNADGMTAPVVVSSSMRCPAIRTHEFHLATISDAV